MADNAMMHMEALYQAHGPAILAYLTRVFGAHAAAEDLLQETFMQALRHQERCLAARSPRAFLFGIARNVGRVACRRSDLTARDTALERLKEGGQTETTPGPLIDMREAIEGLPPLLREALELRLREDLSYEEIAAVLEIPLGTVRSRLHAALRALRGKLLAEEST